jgi:hypothetical protein
LRPGSSGKAPWSAGPLAGGGVSGRAGAAGGACAGVAAGAGAPLTDAPGALPGSIRAGSVVVAEAGAGGTTAPPQFPDGQPADGAM